MKRLWQAEPAVIVSLVSAIIALAVSFGLDLDADQVGGIMAVVTILAGLLTRSQVTSTTPEWLLPLLLRGVAPEPRRPLLGAAGFFAF